MVSRRLAILAALAAFAAAGPAVADEIAGSTIVVRDEGDALIIWEATPAVVAIVKNKTPGKLALKQLESSAVTIAAQHARDLVDATTISVRITYQKIGAVNPAYGGATLAGVESVATVRLSRGLALKADPSIARKIAHGDSVPGVTVIVSGKLPPLPAR